ncbi:RNA polymerase II transcription factor SIII (Elongin) subunit A [Paecilomyces variotii No. 5]|uniref:RNA polymerase II transcription factor SIII (Elongin) subunit A n=1 Tax=Byssochlamys spectabilis (strain No. 5 / NBRC 109023) TaxID=1356009 RepID=V5G1H8_BYSSN|nr:RNA polymerase II transcription factor SIII (Elongin) subunit A [Paecilomyces variotii No. 5]
MPPQSLLQLCTKTAIRSVKYLRDIGELPYCLARPFLLKVESPQQLRSIELQSPHIMKDDKELWLEFIKRDIPSWERFELPEESDYWYDVYCDLQEQISREVDRDAEAMHMALQRINSQRAEQGAKLINEKSARLLPKERPTEAQKYAMYDRKMGGIAPVFVSTVGKPCLDPLSAPRWTYERPDIPRETKKVKPAGIFAPVKRKSNLAIPTHRLKNRASQIKQAPRSLVEQHKQPAPPRVVRHISRPVSTVSKPTASFATTKPASPGPSSPDPSLLEREARLRALTSKKSGVPATQTTPKPVSKTTIKPSIEMPPLFATSPTIKPIKASSPTATAKPTLFSPSSSSKFKSIDESSSTETAASTPATTATPSSEMKRSTKKRAGSFSPPVMGSRRTSASPSPQRQLKLPLEDMDSGMGEPSDSPQARPMVIKKRPAPSIFIQPKRKKVT